MTMTGRKHSEESKQKMRETALRNGRTPSREAIEKSILVNTGKKMSAEARKNMSEAHKKQYEDPVFREQHRLSLLGRVFSEETREKIRKSNTGQPRSAEVREKMRVSANKRWTRPEERKQASDKQKKVLENPEYLEALRTANTGKKHTIESRRKMGLRSKGEGNPRWNGGITDLRKQIHECFKMKIWREEVFKRDGYCDVFTGMKGTRQNQLEAHHIVPFIDIFKAYNITTLEEAEACDFFWDVDNGMTLTKTMHMAYHKMLRAHDCFT